MVIFGKTFTVQMRSPITQTHPADMVWVEPGAFQMGSRENDPFGSSSERRFQCALRDGFWLSTFPISRQQWSSVMKYDAESSEPKDFPATSVNWYEADAFCAELNRLHFTSLPPNYTFGLPYEAQWEYACRGGILRSAGEECNLNLNDIAWYAGNSGGHAHEVGRKSPNPLGLFDMIGNVSEWCQDWMDDYPTEDAVDWSGAIRSDCRVRRGGSWKDAPQSGALRCAARGYSEPITRRPWIGFRIALRKFK